MNLVTKNSFLSKVKLKCYGVCVETTQLLDFSLRPNFSHGHPPSFQFYINFNSDQYV